METNFQYGQCHGCGMAFAVGEHFVNVDINIGAAAAGAGNWVKYHQQCSPRIVHGPQFGPSAEELAALRKDAARYRWLRSNGLAHIRWWDLTTDTSDVGLDHAIDAQMSVTPVIDGRQE